MALLLKSMKATHFLHDSYWSHGSRLRPTGGLNIHTNERTSRANPEDLPNLTRPKRSVEARGAGRPAAGRPMPSTGLGQGAGAMQAIVPRSERTPISPICRSENTRESMAGWRWHLRREAWARVKEAGSVAGWVAGEGARALRAGGSQGGSTSRRSAEEGSGRIASRKERGGGQQRTKSAASDADSNRKSLISATLANALEHQVHIERSLGVPRRPSCVSTGTREIGSVVSLH